MTRYPALHAVLAIVLAGLMLGAAAGGAAAAPPGHVGSGACVACHAEAAGQWSGSHHSLAWTPPTPATVLGDFGNVTFDHAGTTTRFLRDGADYLIETEGANGQRKAFPVVGVAGIDPLQQYLLSPEPGRTQVFDIAWDVAGRRWFPVFPDQDAAPGNGFHWTGPYKSWEARCAECHATGYSRNYEPATRSYAPDLAETGVGCEACHGPGSAHLDWAQDRGKPVPAGLTPFGLTVDLAASQQAEVQQCATCHSLREALGDGNPLPGTPYPDAFSLSLLREGQFHPDGSIQGEVFEAASFLQSKMFAKGVRCSTCHEPHSGALVAEGNAVCVQCHSPAGNRAFPSLPLKVFDGPEHTRHAPGSPAAQCTACHMIERTYMGIDRRHDHGFRIPRPDLAATGAPNGCTDCHADRDAAWAAATLEQWFPGSLMRGPHFATTFAAARQSPETQVQALLDLSEWAEGPGIVRATALDLLGPLAHAPSAERVSLLLDDPDPLVRAAASGALRGLPPDQRLMRLQGVLRDPVRSVRVAAARALLDARPDPGPGADALLAALAEWQKALTLRSDFPETHLQIAGAALTLRNWAMAEQALREAVFMDPQLDQAWSMIARLRAALGDETGAKAVLQQAIRANPESELLFALQMDLGGGLLP